MRSLVEVFLSSIKQLWCLPGFIVLNILLSQSIFAATTVTYTYDELDRLVQVVRSDGPEVNYTFDVVSNIEVTTVTQSPDFDNDQIADFADLDDDNDGMPDVWENQYGFNPLNGVDTFLDSDGDGRMNWQEYQDQTNPLVADKPLDIPALPVWAMGLLLLCLSLVFKWQKQLLMGGRLTSLLIIGGVVFFQIDSAQAELEPAWISPQAEPVSPAEARLILGEPSFEGAFDPLEEDFFIAQSSSAPDSIVQSNSISLIESQSSQSRSLGYYSLLADSLDNDPLKIYQYVRNNFEYIPYFGFLKGPYLTMYDRNGNDFDQAVLLYTLLYYAGISRSQMHFRYGTVSIPKSDTALLNLVAGWLGVETNVSIIEDALGNGGIPVDTSTNNLEFDRLWLEVDIDGVYYRLDPAFKLHEKIGGINLAQAMNYDEAGLLSAAGGIVSSDSVQSLNKNNVSTALQQLTGQLNAYIKQYNPTDTIESIIGE